MAFLVERVLPGDVSWMSLFCPTAFFFFFLRFYFLVIAAVELGPSQPAGSSGVAGGEVCRSVHLQIHRTACKSLALETRAW